MQIIQTKDIIIHDMQILPDKLKDINKIISQKIDFIGKKGNWYAVKNI